MRTMRSCCDGTDSAGARLVGNYLHMLEEENMEVGGCLIICGKVLVRMDENEREQ